LGNHLQLTHLPRFLRQWISYTIAGFLAVCLVPATINAGCPQSMYAGSIDRPGSSPEKQDLVFIARDRGKWSRIPADWVQMRQPPEVSDLTQKYAAEVLSARRFFVDLSDSWWKRKSLAAKDALVVPEFDGGDKASPSDVRSWAAGNHCVINRAWELEQHALSPAGELSRRFAYLLHCGQGGQNQKSVTSAIPPVRDIPKVRFESQPLLVVSPLFKYQMSQSNQMLFDRLEIASQGKSLTPYLENGSFDIRADFRNFLNLHFTADNVGSKVKASFNGIGSAIAKLSFDLKLLFFSLDMHLNTDVLFFERSVFLPMIMKIPRDAWKYVNPGSGVLYSWYPVESTVQVPSWAFMPARTPFKSRQDLRAIAADVAARHCLGDGKCRFRAAVGRLEGDRKVSMEVVVNRSMVEAGFFPQYVADARTEVSEFGWSWKNQGSGSRREGLFFELSGLSRGEHGFEIWIRVVEPGSDSGLEATCPGRTMIREYSMSN